MVQGDPFKTLFVGRLSFDATEKKLQREFEEYGPIKSVTLVHRSKSGERAPASHPPLLLCAVQCHGGGRGNLPMCLRYSEGNTVAPSRSSHGMPLTLLFPAMFGRTLCPAPAAEAESQLTCCTV